MAVTSAPPGSNLSVNLGQQLLDLIREAAIQPGQRLPSEMALCKRFRASRPVIREALRSLEALGIIEARRGSGRVLRKFDLHAVTGGLASSLSHDAVNIVDLLSVRQALEVSFLPAAMMRLDGERAARLEELVQRMVARAERGEGFVAEDRQFHHLLFDALGNQVLVQFLDLFWRMFTAVDDGTMGRSAHLHESAMHHRRVLDAMMAGDARQAQHQMDAHFYDVVSRLAERSPPDRRSSRGGGRVTPRTQALSAEATETEAEREAKDELFVS